MTTITVKINERTKAGKAFLAMASFFKSQKGVEVVENDADTLKRETELIEKLSKKTNKALTKRLLEEHDLAN